MSHRLQLVDVESKSISPTAGYENIPASRMRSEEYSAAPRGGQGKIILPQRSSREHIPAPVYPV